MDTKELFELMKDESFTLSEKGFNLLLKMLSLQYILNNDKPNIKQKAELEQEKEKLLKIFIKEFQRLNKKQVKMYQDYMDKKREISKTIKSNLSLFLLMVVFRFSCFSILS